MAANTYKKNTFKKKETPGKPAPKSKRRFNFVLFNDKRWSLSFGIIFMMLSVFMLLAFLSYLFVGQADQSLVNASGMPLRTKAGETQNLLGYTGAVMSYFMIYRWFGIAALFFPPFLFFWGYKLSFKDSLVSLTRYAGFSLFFLVWLGLLMGYLVHLIDGFNYLAFLSGGFGYELAILSDAFLGWGTFILIFGTLLIFVIVFFNVDQITWFNTADKEPSQPNDDSHNENEYISEDSFEESPLEDDSEEMEEAEVDTNSWKVSDADKSAHAAKKDKPATPAFKVEDTTKDTVVTSDEPVSANDFIVKNNAKEEKTAEMVENLDPYDPTLDLPSYQFPTLDLLNEYDRQKVTVTRQELEENKNKIVETLVNFKIGIKEIKATIGPTVTLYEIIPDPGVKISKIKNLEDDIALSLAALGIRIIAPIPGKGTIGIEVPNKNRELVAARSVLGTEKFMKSDKELPVALGKTISNEVFVVDLAKMPHLLMAGATGQGKSVGLNMILASLIYKKHPSQLKLILVDPKKVELTLFNKIERHFLAKLPNAEEAIITDTKKVIYTLNSLCIEMDNRYDLLKDAGCRNLKEYNTKFVARKLSPEKGHKFMPYIVLVIDELADLMMTAGKEIEGPIARLAQLARAIGIHLVLATQRPSVNVITGIIKANFPARLSFRVTSKIDSRTILDAGGAEQLIGMGDMLLSMGSDVIRLQCAFLDTPEVEAVCDWIGDQRGYSDAYLLPEFVGEEGESGLGEVDLSDRDALFDDAARLIVMHQQGSTSLIQRKLKLGYNRAGRIIDQLEAAGVVGSFEGSKAREVLIQDENTLEQLLKNL